MTYKLAHTPVGEYIPLIEGDVDAIRGHVSMEEYRDGVASFVGVTRDMQGLREVSHLYARWIPVADKAYDLEFRFCKQGRGAFPVTIEGLENK